MELYKDVMSEIIKINKLYTRGFARATTCMSLIDKQLNRKFIKVDNLRLMNKDTGETLIDESEAIIEIRGEY